MNFSYIKKLIFISLFIIFSCFLGAPKISFANSQCKTISAGFTPWMSEETPAETKKTWYKENPRKPVLITIQTENCALEKLEVSVKEGSIDPDWLSTVTRKSLIVPQSEQLTISLKTGEEDCNDVNTDNSTLFDECHYFIETVFYKTTPAGKEPIVFSSDKKTYPGTGVGGNLIYNCIDGCLDSWSYISDTSQKLDSTGTVLEETGSLTDLNSACGDNPDCYELFAGFGKALGEKFATVKPSSLGDFINMLVMFAIGIFGIILFVRIFLLGFQIAQDKKDGKVVALSDTKEELLKAVGGFILLLCIFIILRTINPDLLNLTPRIDALSLEVKSRTDDPNAKTYIDSIDTSEITSHPDGYDDETFLTYLGHQQGAAGAASILWAYHRGYSSIPNSTPFLSNASVTNMRMQKNYFGSGTATPQAFLDYWWKKTEANKKKTGSIPEEINTVLKKVAADTNVSLKTIQVMCMIESFGCSNPNAVNGSYKGLFQMGPSEFATYKRNGATNIFDPYENAYAGAMYSKSNYSYIKKKWNKILP